MEMATAYIKLISTNLIYACIILLIVMVNEYVLTLGIGSAIGGKLGALKNTESFRSMEERVSSAVSTVKVKVKQKKRNISCNILFIYFSFKQMK